MKIYVIIFCLLSQILSCVQNNKIHNYNLPQKDNNELYLSDLEFLDYPIDDVEGITTTRYVGVYRSFDFHYLNGETSFF